MNEVTVPFEWKQGGDRGFLRIDKMASSHLFNTLRMIWNHSAPEEFKLHPYKMYKFGPFYTAEYMHDAVTAMLAELKWRTDLNPYEVDQIRHMIRSAQSIQTLKGLSHG